MSTHECPHISTVRSVKLNAFLHELAFCNWKLDWNTYQSPKSKRLRLTTKRSDKNCALTYIFNEKLVTNFH